MSDLTREAEAIHRIRLIAGKTLYTSPSEILKQIRRVLAELDGGVNPKSFWKGDDGQG